MIDLAETLLTELLGKLHRAQWSGVVAVSSGDFRKALFLRRGRFVFAASTVEEDRLGEFLVRTGRITRDQLNAALKAAAPGKRLGQVLVDTGAVPNLDLEEVVAEQVLFIALSAFRWTHGSVLTEEVEDPIPAELALPLSTERLLLEGARTYPDARRLEQALGGPGRSMQRAQTTRPPFNYRQVPESKAEKAVLAALRTPLTVGELLALPAPRPALVRAVYALLVGGLLQDATSVTPAAGVPMVTGLVEPEPVTLLVPLDEPVPPVELVPPAPSGEAPPGGLSFDVEKRARNLLDRGERGEAIALLRQEASRNPEARACRRLLAMLVSYHEPGLSPETEQLMLDLLREEGGDLELRYRLAVSYKKAGHAARAIVQLKLLLAADPGHAAAWKDLAELEAGEAGGGPGRS